MNTKKSVSILGCGWLGFALAKHLLGQGYRVKGSCTSSAKCEVLAQAGVSPYELSFSTQTTLYPSLPEFLQSDVLLIAVSPGNSPEKKANYQFMLHVLMKHLGVGAVKHLIFLSSTAVYGEDNVDVTESSIPNPTSENGHLLVSMEKQLEGAGIPFCSVRLGGLIGPDRHPGRFFAGRTAIENGLAPVNLIHQADALGILQAIIDSQYSGYVNAVAPSHPSRAEFYTLAAAHASLPLPQFISEKKHFKRVYSTVLSTYYHPFVHPDLLALYATPQR